MLSKERRSWEGVLKYSVAGLVDVFFGRVELHSSSDWYRVLLAVNLWPWQSSHSANLREIAPNGGAKGNELAVDKTRLGRGSRSEDRDHSIDQAEKSIAAQQ